MGDTAFIAGAAGLLLFFVSMTIFFRTTWPALRKEYPLRRGGVPVFGQLAKYKAVCILNWVFLFWLVGMLVLVFCGAL